MSEPPMTKNPRNAFEPFNVKPFPFTVIDWAIAEKVLSVLNGRSSGLIAGVRVMLFWKMMVLSGVELAEIIAVLSVESVVGVDEKRQAGAVKSKQDVRKCLADMTLYLNWRLAHS